jgi:hypothetical protein
MAFQLNIYSLIILMAFFINFRKPALIALVLTILCSGLLSAFCQQPLKLVVPDTVVVAASHQYSRPSFFRQVFMGNNYRQVWNTPVALPVFDLHALQLTIKEMGGGQQTKSLKLETPSGEDWVLRTVDKDVTGAIPKKFRNKITVGLLQDMVSAAHPYAPLIIPGLAQAADVDAANPIFFYVPPGADLGEYSHHFAGKVCLLERREILPGNPKTESTDDMLDELLFKGYSAIDRRAYLRARLLDMLLADWDRHQDQWRWAKIDSAGYTTLLPLPRDRDQALFRSNGLLVKIATLVGKKQYHGLSSNTRHLTKLNIKSWELDRLILNGLDREDWQTVLTGFIQALPDSLIQQAVRRLPPPVYSLNGERIANTLVQRRDHMAESVMDYYSFVAGNVLLYGTDRAEHFEITSNGDSVHVAIRDIPTNILRLERYFVPAETQCLRIVALGGDDRYSISGLLPQGLQLSIDGGPGKNNFHITSPACLQQVESGLDAKAYKKILSKKLRLND